MARTLPCHALISAMVVACLAAAPARAGDTGLQPIVGGAILDPAHDLPVVKRSMALSLVVQGGRQGLVIGSGLAAAGQLQQQIDGAPPALEAPGRHAVETLRLTGILSAANLGIRLTAALITFGARQRLSAGLAGFTVPFLLGGAVDGVVAVMGYSAGIQLRRARRSAGVEPGAFRAAALFAETTLILTAIVSTFSAVTQTMVGISASDFAAYERRREQRVTVAVAPGSLGLCVEF